MGALLAGKVASNAILIVSKHSAMCRKSGTLLFPEAGRPELLIRRPAVATALGLGMGVTQASTVAAGREGIMRSVAPWHCLGSPFIAHHLAGPHHVRGHHCRLARVGPSLGGGSLALQGVGGLLRVDRAQVRSLLGLWGLLLGLHVPCPPMELHPGANPSIIVIVAAGLVCTAYIHMPTTIPAAGRAHTT